jgi:hypothetical protein
MATMITQTWLNVMLQARLSCSVVSLILQTHVCADLFQVTSSYVLTVLLFVPTEQLWLEENNEQRLAAAERHFIQHRWWMHSPQVWMHSSVALTLSVNVLTTSVNALTSGTHHKCECTRQQHSPQVWMHLPVALAISVNALTSGTRHKCECTHHKWMHSQLALTKSVNALTSGTHHECECKQPNIH